MEPRLPRHEPQTAPSPPDGVSATRTTEYASIIRAHLDRASLLREARPLFLPRRLLARGTQLGPYVIEGPVGAGGMGEVYRAHDARLNRTVAIKIVPERVAADEDLRNRFDREVKVLAAL